MTTPSSKKAKATSTPTSKSRAEANAAPSEKPVERASFHVTGGNDSDSTAYPPHVSQTVNMTIHETVEDRIGGTTVTEEIWRAEPNAEAIIRRVHNDGVRQACAEFFLTRRIVKVIESLMPMHTAKPGDVVFEQSELFMAISKAATDGAVANVVMEIVNSFLMRAGMVVDNGNYTTEVYYPLNRVTVASLLDDVAMQEVVGVVGKISVKSLAGVKFTSKTFAAAVAEAMVPVGIAFLNVNELGTVVDDIVKGVLANLTNGLTTRYTGNVPSWWRDHPVVQELSHNYIFTQAALSIPFSANITPVSESFKLGEWASVILSALKSSRRYGIKKKEEVRRHMTKRTLRNLKDQARCYLLHRSAVPASVGQCVYAYQDANLSSAWTLIPTPGRIDASIASAYNGGRKLGTDAAMTGFGHFLVDAIEGGYIDHQIGYSLEVGDYGNASSHELACLLAKSVMVEVRNDMESLAEVGEYGAGDSSNWWFVVDTVEKDIMWQVPGALNGGEFITNSVSAAILVAPDFEAAGPMDERPQMISPKAFNTRVVGFDAENVLREADERFTYDVTVGSSRLTGTLRAQDLGSLKASDSTFLVVPRFNREVFQATVSVFERMQMEIDRMRKQNVSSEETSAPYIADALIEHLQKRRIQMMLEMAQSLNPAFRQEVHTAIIRRSSMGIGRDEALALSARLAQRQFGAFADVSALLLFMNMQGFNIEWSKEMMQEAETLRVLMDRGTDRDAISI